MACITKHTRWYMVNINLPGTCNTHMLCKRDSCATNIPRSQSKLSQLAINFCVWSGVWLRTVSNNEFAYTGNPLQCWQYNNDTNHTGAHHWYWLNLTLSQLPLQGLRNFIGVLNALELCVWFRRYDGTMQHNDCERHADKAGDYGTGRMDNVSVVTRKMSNMVCSEELMK